MDEAIEGPDPDWKALVTRRQAGDAETVRANRGWWDDNADWYQTEHGDYLGDARFLWSPEGVYEDEAGLLGPVSGRRVLEVGCGAAQCARWLVKQGADVVGFDLSARQLAHARRIEALNHEIASLSRELEQLVAIAAPRTIQLLGISTGHAGQLLPLGARPATGAPHLDAALDPDQRRHRLDVVMPRHDELSIIDARRGGR